MLLFCSIGPKLIVSNTVITFLDLMSHIYIHVHVTELNFSKNLLWYELLKYSYEKNIPDKINMKRKIIYWIAITFLLCFPSMFICYIFVSQINSILMYSYDKLIKVETYSGDDNQKESEMERQTVRITEKKIIYI